MIENSKVSTVKWLIETEIIHPLLIYEYIIRWKKMNMCLLDGIHKNPEKTEVLRDETGKKFQEILNRLCTGI